MKYVNNYLFPFCFANESTIEEIQENDEFLTRTRIRSVNECSKIENTSKIDYFCFSRNVKPI